MLQNWLPVYCNFIDTYYCLGVAFYFLHHICHYDCVNMTCGTLYHICQYRSKTTMKLSSLPCLNLSGDVPLNSNTTICTATPYSASHLCRCAQSQLIPFTVVPCSPNNLSVPISSSSPPPCGQLLLPSLVRTHYPVHDVPPCSCEVMTA